MKIKLFLIATICSFCVANQAMAQEDPSFSIVPYAGFLIPHHPGMKHLQNGHIFGASLEMDLSIAADKDWNHFYNFPTAGLSITYLNLASEYLGSSISLIPHFKLPLNNSRSLRLQFGIGLGYVSKPFDIETNLMNNAIGSRLNAALQVKLSGRIAINENIAFLPGISLKHFSNGAFKLPNKGINIAGIDLAFEFGGGLNRKVDERLSFDFERQKIQYFIGATAGLKEVLPLFGPKYSIFSIYGMGLKRISPKSSLGLELGAIYNTSIPEVLHDRGEEDIKDLAELRAHIAAVYKLHFGKLGLMLQAGTYVFDQYNIDGNVFLRYHLQYSFLEDWMISAGLKSHYAKADNIEVGIVFKLN